jgi:hypothetical protein
MNATNLLRRSKMKLHLVLITTQASYYRDRPEVPTQATMFRLFSDAETAREVVRVMNESGASADPDYLIEIFEDVEIDDSLPVEE